MPKEAFSRDFVTIDGKIAIVVANDKAGGVMRGHCDVWFGEMKPDGEPKVEQLLVTDGWKIAGRDGRFVGELRPKAT
jgi:hypothetical protein